MTPRRDASGSEPEARVVEVGGRLGYVVVAWDGRKQEQRVDTYSGFGGDIYQTLAEAEDILFVTRAEGELHRPHERYVVAEVVIVLTPEPSTDGDFQDGHSVAVGQQK